jgi:hypothetical protein
MSVPQQDTTVDDGSLIDHDPGEKMLQQILPALPEIVVIAPQLGVATARLMKLGQPIVNGRMADVDLVELSVFQQLFGIAQLDQGVAFGKVVIERAFEQLGIGRKIVRPAAVAPVGIGKQDKFGFRAALKMDGGDGIHHMPP